MRKMNTLRKVINKISNLLRQSIPSKKNSFLFVILSFYLISISWSGSVTKDWQQRVTSIRWIAYSPSEGNPNKGIEPEEDSVIKDLKALREAGFSGLVTYSTYGILGRKLPNLAQDLGFKGMILGIWDPNNTEEVTSATQAAKNPIILGICVGNEGLNKRYQVSNLRDVMQQIRDATKKPVTTTEEYDDYADEELLKIGDWIFPNVHPYFHSRLDPEAAVRWTQEAYNDMKRRSKGIFVIFKEVGLPTAGDPEGKLSESVQEKYYIALAKTDVCFVYFEAFDLLWKDELPVEPHWGIYKSDRKPKRLGWRLMGQEPPSTKMASEIFNIYSDADSPNNHFKPTGYMGDCGDIHINEVYEDNPHSGNTCIKIVYDAKGKPPNICDYGPPCRWSGVYWQHPPNNWGKDEVNKGKGFNLTGYKKLTFWARSDKECTIEFKVGGIDEKYGDSLLFPRNCYAKIKSTWECFEINLDGADLKHIIGGFCWVSNWDTNPKGSTFYLDDIQFEK